MLKRYELTGTLTNNSPLHIGSAGEGELVDEMLMRDGLGRIVIPGTSLAGILRDQLEEENLWGRIVNNKATSSAITVFDAWSDADPVIEMRTMNSIDRRTGGTAEHHLHTREYVTPGASFRFRCVAESNDSNDESIKNLLVSIRQLLEDLGVHVGKATSTGSGHVTLSDAELRCISFAPSGSNEETIEVDATGATAINKKHTVHITIPFKADGALFVGTKRDGMLIDIVPLVRHHDELVQFLLPGSSIKGVFRSRAEYIARTVTNTEVPASFLDQVSQSGLDAVSDLFGNPQVASEDGTQSAVRGALTFGDVCSVNTVAFTDYSSIVDKAKDDNQEQATNDLKEALVVANKINDDWKAQEYLRGSFLDLPVRNSVDRFSGNTVEGALFSTLEPHVKWESMTISLDLDRLRIITGGDEDRCNAAIALLFFCLIDLSDGLLRFGANTTRGSGGVVVDRGAISVNSIGEKQELFTGKSTLEEILTDVDLLAKLDAAWKTMLEMQTGVEGEEK